MGKHHSVLLSALVLAALTFIVHTEAGAVANGDGSCSAAEIQNKDCGIVNGNFIEFLGAGATTCAVTAGAVPCTAYFYRYTGGASSQVNILIPKKVMTKFTSSDTAAAGCSQLLTLGQGDPTTGFGKNDLTDNVCRIAFSLASLPLGAPANANFSVQADPSVFDPLSWQQKTGNNIAATVINGPGLIQTAVTETGATLQTSDGVTCSYTTAGGGTTLTSCPTGSVVPINQTKLCLPTISGPPTFTNASGSFTCETVSFATEGCDIKTTGTDPCRFINGVCIRY